jgi:flagellar assembly protein FliH
VVPASRRTLPGQRPEPHSAGPVAHGAGAVFPALDAGAAAQVRRFGRRASAASRIAEAQRVRKEAFEDGHAEGYREGYAFGLAAGAQRGHAEAKEESEARFREELDRFRAALDETGEAMLDAIQGWYAQAEESLAMLAVLIAERVVAGEIRTSKETVASIARDALLEVTHASEARIRVNPFESAVLREHRDALMNACASLRSLEVVDDPSVQGGCVIETGGGVIDATIATKLRTIVEGVQRAA